MGEKENAKYLSTMLSLAEKLGNIELLHSMKWNKESKLCIAGQYAVGKKTSSEQLCSPGNTARGSVELTLIESTEHLDSSLQTSPSYNRIIAALYKILS